MKTAPANPQQELIAALRALRLLVREVGGNYLAGLQADVARVERAVAATPEKQRAAELQRMLMRIHNLDVKPAKGRRRDLKELDKLITRLADNVENW